MSIYQELILDHYHYPHNRGKLEGAHAQARAANTVCGDIISITMVLKDGYVEDIRFDGEGCAISTAAASLLTDKIRGMPIKTVLTMDPQDVLNLLQVELTPTRLKCALLPLEAVHKALSTYEISK